MKNTEWHEESVETDDGGFAQIESLRQRTNSHFTLIELLVVIAIIAILLSIMLPALRMARETASEASCNSNERQIYLANMGYVNDNDDYAVAYCIPVEGQSDYWWNTLETYLGKAKVGNDYRYCEDVLRCPTGIKLSQSIFQINYGVNKHFSVTVYDDGTFTDVLKFSRIPAPLAKTLFLMDSVPIGNKTNAGFTHVTCLFPAENPSFNGHAGFRHRNGANVNFVDGHVEWMKRPAVTSYDDGGHIDVAHKGNFILYNQK